MVLKQYQMMRGMVADWNGWMDGWMALVLLEVNGEVPVSFFVFRGHYPLQEFRGATWGGSRDNGG